MNMKCPECSHEFEKNETLEATELRRIERVIFQNEKITAKILPALTKVVEVSRLTGADFPDADVKSWVDATVELKDPVKALEKVDLHPVNFDIIVAVIHRFLIMGNK
jgi:hypothetical protein